MHTKTKYFSIGEFAKLNKISIKTLRYYHEIGLLVPIYIDETNGYRYYSLEQFFQIDIIKMCRGFGASIKEIQELFSHADMVYLDQFIQEKQNDIKEQITHLQNMQVSLELISSKISGLQKIKKTDTWTKKYFPKRYLVISTIYENNEVEEMHSYLDLEKQMDTYNIDSKYEYGTIYNVSSNGEMQPVSIFEVIDFKDFEAYKSDISVMEIPSGYFLTYTFLGGQELLDAKKDIEDRILKHLDRPLILSFDDFTNIFNGGDEYYQMQIYIGETEHFNIDW